MAAQRGLYDIEDASARLSGSHCEACGTRFFPPLAIGCEVCGAAMLSPIMLASSGVVYSSATVHRHAGKGIEVPFTVAEILLDEGPLIRALLTDVINTDIIGQRVTGEWVQAGQDEAGNDLIEPRFRVVMSGAGS